MSSVQHTQSTMARAKVVYWGPVLEAARPPFWPWSAVRTQLAAEEEAGCPSPRAEPGPRVRLRAAPGGGGRPESGGRPQRFSLIERRRRPEFSPREEARVALGRARSPEEQRRPVLTRGPRRGYAPWSCDWAGADGRRRPRAGLPTSMTPEARGWTP
ncbi:hypothetical protein NDU88_005794 [Pleurodeles waltl]|uniref:Uncharacterized protein n=1 Tax=Pleurodeles waltl TaxID=8319 RepID=A0AAV7WC22_PLEWA|nr:hypothetical protein NDU88_005794 [Pleurodeles waltl]